jgi:hypothetical protein
MLLRVGCRLERAECGGRSWWEDFRGDDMIPLMLYIKNNVH